MIFDQTVRHDFGPGEAEGVDMTAYRQLKWKGRIVSEAKWISEPAMWTQWVHLGTMRSVNTSEILVIDCRVFQNITLKHTQVSPGCARYARAFVASLNSSAEKAAHDDYHLSDVPGIWGVDGSEHDEVSELRVRAHVAFEKERLRRKQSSRVTEESLESPSSRRSRLFQEISSSSNELGPQNPGTSVPRMAWRSGSLE